jgi:SAM-dependent methyltransferase
MVALPDEYAPGWADDAIAMMARRTAASRAGFFLPALVPGMQVLDVGCGPGTITLGLADAVAPGGACTGLDMQPSQIEFARTGAAAAGVENVTFVVGSAYELPFADASLDAVFSHALFEHLARPEDAAAELHRVLRPGGVVGVCCSDWGSARIEPRDDDVELALACHLALRRRAGGDPYAGARLEAVVSAAGFSDVQANVQHEIDMSYADFGRYIGTRIEAAAREVHGDELTRLLAGAAAAQRWATREGGRLSQPWTAVLARRD